jgi:hypothetical protein
MATVLGNAIEFLQAFGVFDIILPFLLVFAVVFGILEKTKILGEEKVGGVMYPRKNLNSIVAFVLGLLVVAATKVVGIISEALPKITLLVIVSMSALLSIGLFMKPGDDTIYDKLGGRTMVFISSFMFAAVILIFLGTIPANNKQSWLGFIWDYVIEFWSGTVVATLVLLGVVIWAIFWIASGDTGRGEKD